MKSRGGSPQASRACRGHQRYTRLFQPSEEHREGSWQKEKQCLSTTCATWAATSSAEPHQAIHCWALPRPDWSRVEGRRVPRDATRHPPPATQAPSALLKGPSSPLSGACTFSLPFQQRPPPSPLGFKGQAEAVRTATSR